MIICEECGSANEEGARFCGNCSAYLAWVQPPGSEPAEVEPSGDDTGSAGAQPGDPAREPSAPPVPAPDLADSRERDAATPAPRATPTGSPAATPTGTPGATPTGTPGATPTGTPGATPTGTPGTSAVAPQTVAPSAPPGSPATTGAPAATPAGPQPEAAGPAEPAGGTAAPPAAAVTGGAGARPDADTPSPPPESTPPPGRPAAPDPARQAAAAAMLKPVKPGAKITPAASAPEPARPAPAESVAPRTPAARKPGEAAPKRAPAAAAAAEQEPAAKPGDLICGQCGSGNDASRRFCRRCGASLEAAAVVAELPWYKRIFRRAPKAARQAGSRPTTLHADTRRKVSGVRRAVAWVVLLGVLIGGIWWLRPMIGTGVDWARDHLPGEQYISSDKQTASDSARRHGPALTVDKVATTFWSPPSGSDPAGQFLEYRFADPFRLVRLVMIPGAALDDQAAFFAQGRPEKVQVTVRTSDDQRHTSTWDLPDEAGQQTLYLGIDDVTRVRVTLLQARAGGEGGLVAVAEVAFTTR